MSFPLVTVRQIGSANVQSVNARDLHAFLGVGKVFGAWITERIEQFGFEAGCDFEVFSESGNNPAGGRPAKEYALSVGMAKELAMVERNAKGREVRLYFIDCERRAKAEPRFDIPATYGEALQLAADQQRVLEAQQAKIADLTPKAAALDQLTDITGSHAITRAAKLLGQRPKELFAYLSSKRWIYRVGPNGPWTAYQTKIDAGLLLQKLRVVDEQHAFEQTRVTKRGLAKLAVDLKVDVQLDLLPPPEAGQ